MAIKAAVYEDKEMTKPVQTTSYRFKGGGVIYKKIKVWINFYSDSPDCVWLESLDDFTHIYTNNGQEWWVDKIIRRKDCFPLTINLVPNGETVISIGHMHEVQYAQLSC